MAARFHLQERQFQKDVSCARCPIQLLGDEKGWRERHLSRLVPLQARFIPRLSASPMDDHQKSTNISSPIPQQLTAKLQP
jgi:hypothetical protein